MKVLGFAKAFSQPIATFVLMLSTIFRGELKNYNFLCEIALLILDSL